MLNLHDETSSIPRIITLAFFALPAWWMLFPLSSGFGYEESSKFTGGHLEGTISIKGTLVAPQRFNLVLYADPYYCGRISDGKGWRFTPFTKPGPNRSLPGAIIYLEDIQRGKPLPTAPPIIHTKDCVFHPYVSFAKAGDAFRFQNWDPVEHKVEIYLTSETGGLRLFRQPLPPHPDNRKSDFLLEGVTGEHRAGPEVTYTMDKMGIVLFRCNYHEYMEGWSVVVSHPYVAMAGERGEFSIPDIPPGSYGVVVWHPMGQTTTTVRIHPEQTVNLNVDIFSTSTTTYSEAQPKSDPFGIDLVGDARISPTVELQQWDGPSETMR